MEMPASVWAGAGPLKAAESILNQAFIVTVTTKTLGIEVSTKDFPFEAKNTDKRKKMLYKS
jgi:hypothetical protein